MDHTTLSEEEYKSRSCDGKPELTKIEAIEQARYEKDRTGHKNLRAYKCKFGPHYHIGHLGDSHLKQKKWRCRICGRAVYRQQLNRHIGEHKRRSGTRRRRRKR